MKKIFFYIKDYAAQTNKLVFLLSVLFIAFAIFINYHYGLNKAINQLGTWQQFISWLVVFFIAFAFAYVLQALVMRHRVFAHKQFIYLLCIAPALFAWKMSVNVSFHFSNNADVNNYWNHVVYWPLKLVIMIAVLWLVWKAFGNSDSFYGLSVSGFQPRPYLLMLLMMVPLIALASTQPDFLATYPKLKNIHYLAARQPNGFYKLLYELAYGSDFISIELFFRGFLVLAFVKWAGKDAILPMALFYCTIHFGKPLGECISSFFGGLLLGIVTYNTRRIIGGLIIHLGIAWLMELGGYLGNHYLH